MVWPRRCQSSVSEIPLMSGRDAHRSLSSVPRGLSSLFVFYLRRFYFHRRPYKRVGILVVPKTIEKEGALSVHGGFVREIESMRKQIRHNHERIPMVLFTHNDSYPFLSFCTATLFSKAVTYPRLHTCHGACRASSRLPKEKKCESMVFR